MSNYTNYPLYKHKLYDFNSEDLVKYINTFDDHTFFISFTINEDIITRHMYKDGLIITVYWKSEQDNLLLLKENANLYRLLNFYSNNMISLTKAKITSYTKHNYAASYKIYQSFKEIIKNHKTKTLSEEEYKQLEYDDVIPYTVNEDALKQYTPDIFFEELQKNVNNLYQFYTYLSDREKEKNKS